MDGSIAKIIYISFSNETTRRHDATIKVRPEGVQDGRMLYRWALAWNKVLSVFDFQFRIPLMDKRG